MEKFDVTGSRFYSLLISLEKAVEAHDQEPVKDRADKFR
jgi:hypothetical protein